MKKIIGSEIRIYLKTSVSALLSDISGILVDVDEENMYVKSYDVGLEYGIFVVARDNINYCTIKSLVFEKAPLNYQEEERAQHQSPSRPQYPPQEERAVEPQNLQMPHLDVYVNEQLIARIPVPPTFEMMRWSEDIMKVAMSNPDVRFYLSNRVQKSINYYPGELHVEIEDGPAQVQENNEPMPDNTFSMTMGGNVATQFLNPAEMVTRLNAMKRVRKPEKLEEPKQEQITNVKS